MTDYRNGLWTAVIAERDTHTARGYDHIHDRLHGRSHLHELAEHYIGLGTAEGVVKAASLVLAAREMCGEERRS
ncbi:hypothetical protein [Nocardia sp. NPDC046763]|uniref:hypothetical protein n=1 Tax=Nocardia sp. NPDC046763 TaxID=3155256 RepID=UPI0033F3BA6F